jgi:hypothetical protein
MAAGKGVGHSRPASLHQTAIGESEVGEEKKDEGVERIESASASSSV